MTIKFLTLLSCILLIAIQSFGQENSDSLVFKAKAEKYRKMKKAGSILTLGGGGVAVTSIVGLLVYAVAVNTSSGPDVNDNTVNAGFAAFYIGGGLCAVGAPLWIVGKKRERKYKNKYPNDHDQSGHARLNLYPRRNGLTLTYRF